MIWLLLLCAGMSVLWVYAEIGWADERYEREHDERTIQRLRDRNLAMAAMLWATPSKESITRIVAHSDAEAVDALIADVNREVA